MIGHNDRDNTTKNNDIELVQRKEVGQKFPNGIERKEEDEDMQFEFGDQTIFGAIATIFAAVLGFFWRLLHKVQTDVDKKANKKDVKDDLEAMEIRHIREMDRIIGRLDKMIDYLMKEKV